MIQQKIETFKKANRNLDVLGLVRHLFPDVEVETTTESNNVS